MRQIILDTETTGLEPSEGHRIIEIGCVEPLTKQVCICDCSNVLRNRLILKST